MEQPRSGVELYFAQDVATFFVLISPNMCQGLGKKGLPFLWPGGAETFPPRVPNYPATQTTCTKLHRRRF